MPVCTTLQSFFAKNLNSIVPAKLDTRRASHKQVTIQLQHTRILYYPILTIALQSFDCDRYGNLHYYRVTSS